MSRAIPTPSNCRSCGSPVFWAETEKGKKMPVDADPSPEGNVQLFVRADGTVRCVVLGPDAARQIVEASRILNGGGRSPLRTSHFKTCPHAAQHRRST